MTRRFFTRVTSDGGGSGLSPVGVLGRCCCREPGFGTLMPVENSLAGQQGHVGSHSGKLQLPSWSPVPPTHRRGAGPLERGPPAPLLVHTKYSARAEFTVDTPQGAGPPWRRTSSESPPHAPPLLGHLASAGPAWLAWLWGAAVCHTCPPTLEGPRVMTQPHAGRANICACQPLSREAGTW